MERSMPPVIVLGLSPNGLSIVRSLEPFGMSLIGIARNKMEIGRHSRYLTAIVILENDSDSHILKALTKIRYSCNEKPILLFENDFFVSFADRNRSPLNELFEFNIHPNKFSEVFSNKNSMVDLAQNFGLNTPKTVLFFDNQICFSELQKITFPCVLKPINSNVKNWEIGKKIVIVANYLELSEFLRSRTYLSGKIIIQESISGSDSDIFQCHEYCNKKQEILDICITRKIHQYRPKYGVGSKVISYYSSRLQNYVSKFLSDIGYTGAISIEFKFDRKQNKLFFIEMNPRRTLHHLLCAKCDCNFSLIEYLDLIGEPPMGNICEKKVKTWIKSDIEFKRCKYLEMNTIVCIFFSFIDIIKAEVHPIYSINDPIPYIIHLGNQIQNILQYLGDN